MKIMVFENKFVQYSKDKQESLLMILGGVLGITLAAQITILLQPVPITLQTFAILLVGMLYGPKRGMQTVLIYVCAGVVGLPVFAHCSGGIHILLGPTGGYILGFVPAAAFTGYLLQRGWIKHPISIFSAALFGVILLFIPGYLVLANFIGYQQAYYTGVAPFYLVELCKLITLTWIAQFFWRRKI